MRHNLKYKKSEEKKVKKKLSLLLVVVLACSAMMVGCGSKKSSNVEGTTWKATGAIDPDGNEITEEDFVAVFGETTYEFKKDGELVLSAAGQYVDGTWSQEDSEVTIDAGGITATATVDGDTMTLENGGSTVTFEKK